ncbi:PilZ domain-containing protein [Shewanella psychrotolerans]|uniref:PilZ domain-containing protein n=1 Tax=Shewanella psychrotolerans TaxID=2864206 RepID=UPI001C657975|nr:PilZ domain-containing protein [Shewanella psychrotolerans]QYK00479.1 PilZ domain-containing protein [Shewanella psychrotolerans]
MSLEQHNALIEQLKPLLMEENFQELFENLTSEESNSTRFLLKMELNRLSSLCTRVIDLRDKSELPCETVKSGSQTHFLDAPAKNSFIQALALYQGQYTLGVYEQVMETHKLRRQKARDSDSDSDMALTPFIAEGAILGSYFNRSEERMNYSIRISALQPGSSEIGGITVDLSVGGARIRLPASHGLNIEQPLRIKLLDLSKEYYFEDLQQGVDYQVVDVEGNHEYSWMRLKRLGGSDALAEMLGNLIQGYKFRYKVDINDILVAATGLGFERHYLPHLPHLPLYVEHIEEQYKITHKLLSRDNQKLQHFFSDEKEINQLPGMLTPNRLKALIDEPDNIEHALFFCFTFQTQGNIFFYSATLAELLATDLLGLFIRFGSSKSTWSIFKLTSHEIDHPTSYKSSILPGDSSYYSPLTEVQLKRFSHVLQLIDLTNNDMLSQYGQWDAKGHQANELKQFGQKKLTSNQIKLLSLQFTERRNEARFSFKTLVTVTQGKESHQGFTLDISGKGLQVTLDGPATFDATAPLYLSFPKLQHLAGKAKLSQLPYRLIRTRKNGITIHLAAMVGHSAHIGVAFLNRLIEANRDKLQKLTEANSDMKELSDGLKNLLMRELASVPYFIEKTSKSAKLGVLGVSKHSNEITDLFAATTQQSLQYDLSTLLDDGHLKRDFIDPIRQMKPQHGMEFFEVYVQVSRQSQGRIKMKCIAPKEIGDEQAQIHFIRQSQNLGKFMALRIYRGATSKPDMSYIKRELEYIKVHAPHKAKQLELKMWRIIGVGELLDVTPEVMLRYPSLYN